MVQSIIKQEHIYFAYHRSVLFLDPMPHHLFHPGDHHNNLLQASSTAHQAREHILWAYIDRNDNESVSAN